MQTTTPIRLIVTDDHSLFRNGVKAALQHREGIEIIGEAIHGQDLLNQLLYLQPDIILLGISMPVMDGLTALPLIRKRYPHIKVIMLSMHNDPGIICRAIELGASTYLTKESGAEKIYQTILECRQRWFYINDIVRNAIIKRNPAELNTGISSDPQLNEKEIAILKLLGENKSVDEIAKAIDLSTRTVDAILEKLKKRAGTDSIEELISFYRSKN